MRSTVLGEVSLVADPSCLGMTLSGVKGNIQNGLCS